MRFSDWVILAFILFTPMVIASSIEQDRQSEALRWRINYDHILDRACEDAVLALAVVESSMQTGSMESGGAMIGTSGGVLLTSGGIEPVTGAYATGTNRADGIMPSETLRAGLNLDAGLDQFRKTVYMGFGYSPESQSAGNALNGFMPVQVVVGHDRLFVHEKTRVTDSTSGRTREIDMWQPGIPFGWYDQRNQLVVGFTLTDHVSVFEERTGAWHEGDREEMASHWPSGIWGSEAAFENQRRMVITDLVRETLARRIWETGGGSTGEGGRLVFNIPYDSGDSWYNAIDGISFIGYIEGMPIPGIREVYTTASFGGGRLTMADVYPGNFLNGRNTYHREGCSFAFLYDLVFPSRTDAASEGYFPCPECKP